MNHFCPTLMTVSHQSPYHCSCLVHTFQLLPICCLVLWALSSGNKYIFNTHTKKLTKSISFFFCSSIWSDYFLGLATNSLVGDHYSHVVAKRRLFDFLSPHETNKNNIEINSRSNINNMKLLVLFLYSFCSNDKIQKKK